MNGSKPIWRFPLTFDGGGIGFNDGGTQLFKDDSIQSLAREVCQNSIDASLKGSIKPVEVEFKTFKIKKEDFPGYEQFKQIINEEITHCQKFYKNNLNALNYYKDALSILEKDEILCLRISDFNTTGLTLGTDPKNNHWANLVVHSGTNDKNPEEGGAFGLGKNAMYACSKFGSLYFSTYNLENKKQSECIAKLSYYYKNPRDIVHGLGFYGNYLDSTSYENDSPIPELCNLDKSFLRRNYEYGTDVYILGFEIADNDLIGSGDDFSKFENDISSAIIDNYFNSIINNKLIVKINDIEINKENLYEIYEKIYSKHKELFNPNTADYLEVMKSPNSYPICIMEEGIPDAVLKLELNPNYHNRVAIIKNTGMKIFDKGSFPQITIFSGILKLTTKEVNGYFKKMENPTHDEWVLERIKEDKNAKKRYDRMLEQIKEVIKKLAKDNAPEEMNVVGLGEFLPDDYSLDGNEKEENIVDDIKENLEIKERLPYPVENETEDFADSEENKIPVGVKDENGEYDVYDQKDGKKTIVDNDFHENTNNPSSSYNKKLANKSVKKRICYQNAINEYILSLIPNQDINDGAIAVRLSGEQASFEATIVNAYILRGNMVKENLKIQNNKIILGKITKGSKVYIHFNLENTRNHPLEVEVYEN